MTAPSDDAPMPLSEAVALLATSVQMIEATYGHHSPEFQAAASNFGRKSR